jgi:hypothetical protein
VRRLESYDSMAQKSADRRCVSAPRPSSSEIGRHRYHHHATDGRERWHRQRLQCRDDGARALRAVFSSHDIWLSLSEAERDEWRGYFDRMLEWLQQLGYTPERNPWSMLLEDSTAGAGRSNQEAS